MKLSSNEIQPPNQQYGKSPTYIADSTTYTNITINFYYTSFAPTQTLLTLFPPIPALLTYDIL